MDFDPDSSSNADLSTTDQTIHFLLEGETPSFLFVSHAIEPRPECAAANSELLVQEKLQRR